MITETTANSRNRDAIRKAHAQRSAAFTGFFKRVFSAR